LPRSDGRSRSGLAGVLRSICGAAALCASHRERLAGDCRRDILSGAFARDTEEPERTGSAYQSHCAITHHLQLNEKGIEKVPHDKPVVYRILTAGGRVDYVGVAKRGRVQERLQEHLPGGQDPIPGAKVQIEQMKTIAEAEAKEARIISRNQPPHNEQGK
jgi:hypothetical protein